MKLYAWRLFKVFLLLTCVLLSFQNAVRAANSTPTQIAIQNKSGFGYKATSTALNVKATYDDATWVNLNATTEVTWTSNNNTIATVSNGVVTFTGATGDVTITANVNGITDSVTTTVTTTPKIIGSFAYSSSPLQLQFVDQYPDGSTKTISGAIWTSSNTNVAAVGSTGLVTFKNKQGDVTITAQNSSKTKTASVPTTVPFKSFKINQTNLTYTSLPNPIQLTISGVNYDNTLVPITGGVSWSVSAPSIAIIDSTGKLTFTGVNGSVTITAQYLGNSTSVVATINIPKSLTSISINNSTTFAYNASPITLSVTGNYSDSTKTAITSGLVWSSSNTSVATVSSNGVVTFTGKNGDVTIKAQYGSLTATVSTTVNITVNSLIIESTGTFGYSSSPVTLKAKDGATVIANVSWSSSDTSIATISSGGVVTFTGKNGTVTIYATYGDKTANISTTVNIVTSSVVINGSLSYRTTTLQLTATVMFPDGKKQTVTKAAWSSSNGNVATISDTGIVTFTGNNGPLTIYVTYGNQTASIYGNIVNPNQLTSLQIDQALYYSTSPVTLTLSGTTQNGTKQNISASNAIWMTSNAAIATVTNGVVYFTGQNGTVTISATYNNKTATRTVTVNSAIQVNALMINQTLVYSPNPVYLTLTAIQTDGKNVAVNVSQAVWSSSDTTIATVNNGVVSFTGKNGSVTVTAYYGNKSANVATTVANTVSSIKINQVLTYSPTSYGLTLTATLTNGTTQYITNAVWSSNNPAVATVSNGIVTFSGASGSVTITATYGGKSASVSTTVTAQSGNPFSSNIINKTSLENNILLNIRNTPALSSISNYKDTETHWAKREIKIGKKLSLITGYSDNTYKPDNNITRGDFVTMVGKVFNIQPAYYTSSAFKDITDHPARGYVIALSSLGVISGYPDRTFQPEGEITRAEVVTILTKLINLNQVPANSGVSFVDTNGHWAASMIKQIAATGLLSGRGNGRFDPNANTTRAEAISLMLRTLGLDSTIKSSFDAL